MGAACPTIGMVAFAKFSLTDPQVLIATGLLSATLFAGAIIIALVGRWRRKQENETFTTHDNLAAFRILYERGELSADEFERIKKQLLGRLKQESEAPAKPAAPQAPSTAITDSAAQPLPPLPPETNDQSSDR
jgi:putative oligomerization/nucleic acid binding protein